MSTMICSPVDSLTEEEAARVRELYPYGFFGDNVIFLSWRGEAVSCLSYRSNEGVYELYDVYTAPQWRGLGLATKCVKYFVEMARLNGAKIAWLGTRDENLIPFYEKHGFVAEPPPRRLDRSNYLGDLEFEFSFIPMILQYQ